MLVCLLYCHKDAGSAVGLLDWMAQLEPAGLKGHEIALIASSQVPTSQAVALDRRARDLFGRVETRQQTAPDERNVVTAAKALFRIALLEVSMRSGRGPFLSMEPDCIPLCAGWLDKIQAAYAACGRPFMGTVYPHPRPHVNGCCVWPQNALRLNKYLVSDNDRTFDNDHPELTLRHAHDTPLIQRLLANTDPYDPQPMTFPTRESLGALRREAVLFHGCKDGTLIARLRERLFPAPEIAPAARRGRGGKAIARMARAAARVVVGSLRSKLHLPDVTLVCVDTHNPGRARRAIDKTLEQITPGAVLFFTNDTRLPDAIKTPFINGIEAYSNFLLSRVVDSVRTSHLLVVHWDGYALNARAWDPDWLRCDYIGAPWLKVNEPGHPFNPKWNVGNGGFSLRSARLMRAVRDLGPPYHPEDQVICLKGRPRLEELGLRFATTDSARRFAVEYGVYEGQFGFHSFNNVFPAGTDKPLVFHHSGDWGDVIYGLAAVKAKGGGLFYMSEQPLAMATRQRCTPEVYNNIAPLIRCQTYIWASSRHYEMPNGADYDLNDFRKGYRGNVCLAQLQASVCGASVDETRPWLSVDFEVRIPERPICVSRSYRYRDSKFPWAALMERWHSKMFFIGTADEWSNLVGLYGFPLPRIECGNLLDVARLIAGAQVFVGNQSAPLAIAHGLCKAVVQEEFVNCPGYAPDCNCRFLRPKTLYSGRDEIRIEKGWLKQ